MYNISTREGESYFLRTLLLHKSGANSLENMRFHEGVQYSTFRDTCLALGVLSDDTEWLRCMQDAFAFNFDRLTEVFSIIMGFLNVQTLCGLGRNQGYDDNRLSTETSRSVPI